MLMMTYMFCPMAMSTTCFTRAIQSAGILVEPSVMWQFQDTGMRMALKPAAFTALISAWLVTGLPHAVSPQMASSVLPRFQPRLIWLATWGAVGRVWARVGKETEKEMAASSIAQSSAPRHFAAEGLRSDIGVPLVVRSIDQPAGG